MKKVTVSKIKDLIIVKKEDTNFFISTKDSFIISIANFSLLLKFLVEHNLISVKVLEGVIDEYRNRDC